MADFTSTQAQLAAARAAQDAAQLAASAGGSTGPPGAGGFGSRDPANLLPQGACAQTWPNSARPRRQAAANQAAAQNTLQSARANVAAGHGGISPVSALRSRMWLC